MTVLGFVKFLPLPLFCMAIAQLTTEQRRKLLETVPLSGAVMTVLSAALCLIPLYREYILTNGRLGGFFQYPNTFAIFLLVGIVIQLYGKPVNLRSAVICVILLSGIFASGSRTVFILMALALVMYLIAAKNKRMKLLLVCMTGVIVCGDCRLRSDKRKFRHHKQIPDLLLHLKHLCGQTAVLLRCAARYTEKSPGSWLHGLLLCTRLLPDRRLCGGEYPQRAFADTS